MESSQCAPSTSTPAPTASTSKKPRRPRILRACDSCRTQKIRCEGGTPEAPCARCVLKSTACTFEERGKTKQPPKSYVESLEMRLEAMEALLRKVSRTAERDIEALGERGSLMGGGDEVVGGSVESSPVGDGKEGEEPREEEMDALGDEVHELSIDKDRWVGRGSGIHTFAKTMSTTAIPGAQTFHHRVTRVVNPSLVEVLLLREHKKRISKHDLPPPDLFRLLVDAYFDSVNSNTPLLHRPSFERAIAAGMADSDSSFRCLLFIILALGARFIDDPRLVLPIDIDHPQGSEQSRGYTFFLASVTPAKMHLISATLFDLQSSVLTVFWLMGATTPISAWAAVGFAIDVGAHCEKRHRWTASPLEDQLRKRAFYTLVGNDRGLSAMLGRPLAIQEDDFDLSPPLSISDAALDEWNVLGSGPPPELGEATPVACALCLGRLQRIMGRAVKALYSLERRRGKREVMEAVLGLDSQLNEWLEQVPEHLRWNPSKQDPRWFPQSVSLYCAFYSCQILIHKDNASPNQAVTLDFPSLAICSNAARATVRALDLLRERGHLEVAFVYAPMTAISAGLILLMNAFRRGPSARTDPALDDANKCLKVLETLGKRTFIAQKAFGNFTQLVALATATSNPATTPSTTSAGASLKRPRQEADLDSRPSPSSLNDLFPPLPSSTIPSPSPLSTKYIPTFPSPLPSSTDFGIDLQSAPSLPTTFAPSNDAFYNSFETPPLPFDPFAQGLSVFGAGLDFQYAFNFDPTLPVDWDSTFGSNFNFDEFAPVVAAGEDVQMGSSWQASG